MELNALLRKHFAMSGITSSLNNHPLNASNLTIFLLLCITVASMAASIREAKTYDESTAILFQSVSIGVCCIVYVIIVWKTSILFEFIDRLDDTIKESEKSNLF